MVLKKGSKGEEVKIWQKFLAGRGFGIKPDGDFGPATENATRLFQHDVGLPGDGIAGPNTFRAAEKRGFAGFPSNEEPKSATGKTILVSAGHTNIPGQDRGASGNGRIEGVLAVELRDSIAANLRSKGCKVKEDGDDGESEPLKKALDLARKSDIAVEIHWNAAASNKATGVEALAKPKQKALAQALAGAVSSATGLPLRGDKGYKADNSGQHHRLAFCEAGGIILEVCFITNKHDLDVYFNNFDEVATNIADALAEAAK